MRARAVAAMENRRDSVGLLLRACGLVLLHPQDEAIRRDLAAILAGVHLASADGDSLLVAALIDEASAHADELAFRLEAPGYPSLYISAVTSRLCRTLTVLQGQLAANDPDENACSGAAPRSSGLPSTHLDLATVGPSSPLSSSAGRLAKPGAGCR